MRAPALRLAAAACLAAARSAGGQRCELQENVDYEGHEFWWELGLTQDECCALCRKEPNCTVAVLYRTGCYLKSSATRMSSQKEGRCALVPGRAAPIADSTRPRALEQPALEENVDRADELSFCPKGYCRRDAVEQEGAALSSTIAQPQECVELESLGSSAEKIEAPALWRRSAMNSKLRRADLEYSGYNTSRCDHLLVGVQATPRSMLMGVKDQESRDQMTSDRCDFFGCGSFDSSRACQCDPSCGLFENCCADYEVECVDDTAVVSAAPAATLTSAVPITIAPEALTTVTTTTPETAVTTTTVTATATTATTVLTTTMATSVTAMSVTTTAVMTTTAVTTTTVTSVTATSVTTTAVTSPAPTTTAPTTLTAASTTTVIVAPTATVAHAASTSAAPIAQTTESPNIDLTVTAPAPATSEVPPMTSTPAPTKAATTSPPPASKAQPGNCRTYGCGRFWEEHACQCNALCTRYDNCCSDYSETCTQAGRPGAGGAATGGSAAHSMSLPPPPKPKAANAPARSCKIEKDVEFSDASGEEMGTVQSDDECASVCVSMPDCTHFSVNATEFYKICAVKRGKPGRRHKRSGAASGLCGPVPADEVTALATGTEKADERRHATPPAPPVPPEPLPQVSIDIFRAMKAAAADEQETLDDDMADLLGDLKYVHTELLTEHLLDPIRQSRKYDIDCIRRQRYVFRNPAALATAIESPLPDFGPFVTYDFGVATNTDQLPMLEKYGDFIGIQEGCSGGHCDVRFPAESPYLWFSVGNFCPNLPWGHKGDVDNPNAKCLKYEEGGGFLSGGLCQDGWSRDQAKPSVEPTGERGCIYAYGASQVISLDEIVGITSESCGGGQMCEGWADFRQNCADAGYKKQFDVSGEVKDVKYCVEYDIHPSCEASCDTDACQKLLASGRTVELGLPFWRGRCDPRANLRRAEKLADLFGVEGALTEHRLLHQDVLGLQIPCVREDSGRCRPDKDAGGPYCTRSFSGVCQTCFIPGAANSEGPPAKPFCPFDIFETVDYNDSARFPAPRCRSSNARDGCCLYAGTCAGESDPKLASLDDDGFSLVASRRHTGDLATFLRRAVRASGGDADAWKAVSDEAVQAAAYHQWAQGFTGRTLQEALAEAEALLREGAEEENGRAWAPSEVMFKKFLALPHGASRARGPQGSPFATGALVPSLALVAATGVYSAWRMAKEGRNALYTEVGGEAVLRAPSGQEAPLLSPGPRGC